MKISLSVLLLAMTALFSFTSIEEKGCKKKNYHYSPASYESEIFMKEKYRVLFDSLLTEPVYDCFCKQKIKDLPVKAMGKNKLPTNKIVMEVSIEPFFVNLKNNEGLYGKRVWRRGGPSVRFRCGYFHYLFILSGNAYFPLTEDSLTNVKMVKEKLSASFTEEEIEGMIKWDIGDNMFCNHYTYDWPYLIKNDTTILWDIKKELLLLSE